MIRFLPSDRGTRITAVGALAGVQVGEQLRLQGSWEQGRRVGVFLRWDRDGNPTVRHEWKDGLEHGAYVAYHPDGNKAEEGRCELGSRIGEWTSWHANGNLERKGTYVQGKEDGEWTTYDEDGEIRIAAQRPQVAAAAHAAEEVRALQREAVAQRCGLYQEWG